MEQAPTPTTVPTPIAGVDVMDEGGSLGMSASPAAAAAAAAASLAMSLSATAASTSPVPVPAAAAPAAGDDDNIVVPTQTQMEEDDEEDDDDNDDDGSGEDGDEQGDEGPMEVDEEAAGDDDDDNESADDESGDNSSGDDDDDEDDDEDDNEADEDEPSTPTTLGGSIPTAAYALLTGLLDDPKRDDSDPTKRSVISVPITRLPAVLGRTHKTKDANFFSLGEARLLSRNHVRIHHLDGVGGSLRSAPAAANGDGDGDGDDNNSESDNSGGGGLVYHHRSSDDPDEALAVKDIVRPSSMKQLPSTGYFVLQCLGKNKITVGGSGKDGQRIGQGEAAVLQNGTTVRFAGFSLYFLLPKNSATTTKMQVPNPLYAAFQKKRAREEAKAAAAAVEAEAAAAAAAGSAAAAAPATAAAKKAKTENASSATGTSTSAGGAGGGKVGQAKVIADLEALPTATLLQRCHEAVASDDAWGRPHQLLNSAVAVHAVMAAGRSAELRAVIEQHGGVTRGEVLNWVKKSSVFSGWVNLMLGKLNVKSYEKNISVAITRAGFTKHGHQRWAPPANLGKEEEKKEGSNENGNNDQKQEQEVEQEDDNDNDDDALEENEGQESEGEGDDGSPKEERSKSGDDMQVDQANASAAVGAGAGAVAGTGPPSPSNNEDEGDPRAPAPPDSPSSTKSFGTDDPDGALV